MKRIFFCIAAGAAMLCIFSATPAVAQHDHRTVAAPAVAPTEGTIKKIDRKRGIATLAHGPILNLGMDAMTMGFKAKEPRMLDRFKVGDRVRFVADYVGGEFVIVRIEAAP